MNNPTYKEIAKDIRDVYAKYPKPSVGSCVVEEDGKVVGMCAVAAAVFPVTKDERCANSSLAKYGMKHDWIGKREICPSCHKEDNVVVIIRHHLNDGHGNTNGKCCAGWKEFDQVSEPWSLDKIADWLETL